MTRAGAFMRYVASCLFAILSMCPSISAQGEEMSDDRPATFSDPFIENLVGDWIVNRQIRGKVVQNTLQAEWVLNHQFLQLHMKDVADPPAYEALVLIGYSRSDKRYVAHWCDTFGGGASATGYGRRDGDSIEFVFEYPDGPFFNTFSWTRRAESGPCAWRVNRRRASGSSLPSMNFDAGRSDRARRSLRSFGAAKPNPGQRVMTSCANAEEALAFVREHGVVLASAKGTAPRLAELLLIQRSGRVSGDPRWTGGLTSRSCSLSRDATMDIECRTLGPGDVELLARAAAGVFDYTP